MPFKIVFRRLFVEFGTGFDHVGASLLGLIEHVGRNFFVMIVGAESFILPDHGLHANEINDALEFCFSADRQLDRNRLGAEAFLDVVEALLKKSAPVLSILLQNTMRGTLILVALAPNRLGLRLNALV